ncbi:hypothetical protein F5X68DRAFT_61056 [Plectosphaerella plurivora]|uniref:Zn(2)-C6 fungal-type domain-containing protein n=1 Tax=Plectosphaerella plurivora TaxID=936078 RepID=A0A9P9A6Q4_9PEZI|nr:hypothetical protein F5X68DRAFT_61056 [Plectosphaerella plurivora]
MKGCYTCERRRIRCDRASPSCRKCHEKGLECPGYGQRLRWAGGAATRGRLLQIQEPPPPQDDSTSSPATPSWMHSTSWDALAGAPLNRLIDHWERNIACRMVWIDSPSNPYRVLVAPLARVIPVIGLALAAVSSQHASGREEAALSERCRNEAVAMISAYVRSVADGGGQLLDREPVEWVLAAMMLLSCYEMTDSGAAAADFHRRAARSLVNTFDAAGPGRDSKLFAFLRNQLAIHDVFACTTSFDPSTMHDVVLPGRDDRTVLFSTYLVYLLDVTILSRVAVPSRARSLRMGLTMRHVQARFDIARGETLMASGPLLNTSAIHRRDFICVVNITHHAALLYAARCLELDGDEDARAGHLDSLFDQLAAMTAPEDWLHCIAWSLFIAGVESHGDASRQAIVTGLYEQLYEGMRFRNFRDALDFLRQFWAETNEDWRGTAKVWEGAGHTVLLP